MDNLKNNIKNMFDKIFDYCKKNQGVSVLIVLVFIIIIFTFAYLFNARNISSIEEEFIVNNSRNLVNYLDDLVQNKSKKVDKYILFALDYSYNVNSNNQMTVDEIYDFITEHFTLKVTKEDIKNIGITPLLAGKNVTYDVTSGAYKFNSIKVDSDTISKTPVTYYKLESISKISRSKYVATYTIYTISNPYDAYNYYMDKNQKNNGMEVDGNMVYDLKDLLPMRNYLAGSGSINSFKNSIDSDVSKFAKKGKKVKITFVNKNSKLLISKVR